MELELVLGEQCGAVVVGFERYCEWLCGVGIGFGGARSFEGARVSVGVCFGGSRIWWWRVGNVFIWRGGG